jgi:hypothetical protein
MRLFIPKQFSLRVFLVASVLSGLCLGLLLPEMQRMLLIARIERQGGVVQYDESIHGYWKSTKVTRIVNPPSRDKLLSRELLAFPYLREIGIGGVTSDAGTKGEFVMDVDTYKKFLP